MDGGDAARDAESDTEENTATDAESDTQADAEGAVGGAEYDAETRRHDVEGAAEDVAHDVEENASTVARDAKKNLARTLLSESEAYGYTLTIWGSGALLIGQYGPPSTLQAFTFVTGALAGFATLVFLAFDDFMESPDTSPNQETKIVLSMVHFLATFGNLLVVYAVIAGIHALVPPAVTFALVGFEATVVYDLLLLVEHVLPSEI